MNKEHYEAQKTMISNHIDALVRDMDALTKQYIEENKKFHVGQKVVVTNTDGREHIAFVSMVFVDIHKEIGYRFVESDEYGNPTKKELWAWLGYNVRPY